MTLRKYLPPSPPIHLAEIDDANNLMWELAGSSERLDFKSAKDYVAKLNSDKHLGFDDWRLPELRELHGLVDYTRHDPAIDTDHFPCCKSAGYWTSTAYAPSHGDVAWVVYFFNGSVSYVYHYGTAFVRAVRSMSPEECKS